jgi:ADP-heptose:LPS heptosyltransferase
VTVLDQLPPRARVAVIRLRSLGVWVLTTPALRILKSARPDLEVAIVVEDRFRAIFEHNPDIDAILGPTVRELRAWRPSLCLNLHGGTRSARLTALSGAPNRAAFEHFPHQFLYNIHIPKAQQILGLDRKVHTAEHLASAIFYLGAPRTEIPRAVLWSGPTGPRGNAWSRHTVLHPFGSESAKIWPHFQALVPNVENPLFIGAPADDLAPFHPHVVLPLSELKTLLSKAALFIGNDSGPAHMAAAFGIPVVVFFSVSDPEIWGPWRTTAEVLTAPDLRDISVAQVLEAAAHLRVPA